MTSRTLAITLAASLAAPAVGAETIGVLAVSEPPGPSAELVEITAQLRTVLAENTPGVLPGTQLRERMTGQTPTASLSELDRAFAGALATYQSGDFEGSIRTLRAVVEDLERLPDSPEAFAQWSRAMLRLARAEQTMGRHAESRAVLQRLVRANPQVKADPTQYPPSFVKQVDEALAALKGMKTRKLVVNAQKGVRVFVDGRDVGPAPVTVNLPPDRYRVSGAMQEVRVPGLTVDLTAEDQTVELDLRLAEALRPAGGPGLALAQADRARRIITTAAWLGLDRAVIATLVQEADVSFLVGTLYDVRRGATEREGRLRLAGKAPPSGGLNALAAFLMTGQASSLVAVTTTPPKPVSLKVTPPKPEPAPVVAKSEERTPNRTWKTLGWTAVGTGVAAVALGGFSAYQVKRSNDLYDEAKAMRVGDTVREQYTVATYNSRVEDGDSARSLAVATGIGAGVALATSCVLGYLSYRQTGEIGPIRF